jgi:hypothetical protein
MELDKLITESDPARRVRVGGADSAEAARLYRQITELPPDRTRGAGLRPRMAVPLAVTGGALGLAAAVTFATLPGSSGGPRENRAPDLTAAVVLDAAAATAARRPALVPGPGQYLYIKDIEVKGAPRGGKAPACDTIIGQEWLARDGSGRQVGTSPGCRKMDFTQTWPKGGNGLEFNYLAWRGLPVTPLALERAIVRRFEGGHPNNAITFLDASTILSVGAPPAIRTALYHMIAELPGVEYLGRMTDPLGRPGVGVGLIQKAPRGDVMTIFDPATSAVLALGDGATRSPRGMPPWFSPTTYVKSGIVDSIAGTPPAGSGPAAGPAAAGG